MPFLNNFFPLFFKTFHCSFNNWNLFFSYKVPFNPFTPGTLMGDNPLIPWDFLVENKCMRAPKINHMCFKTRVKTLAFKQTFSFRRVNGQPGYIKNNANWGRKSSGKRQKQWILTKFLHCAIIALIGKLWHVEQKRCWVKTTVKKTSTTLYCHFYWWFPFRSVSLVEKGSRKCSETPLRT